MTGGAGPRRKGSTYERAVVDFFRASGFPECERSYGAGRPDGKGDLANVPGVTAEIKNHAHIDLAGFVDQAEREQQTAGTPYGVAVIKRRGKPVAKSYVVISLDQFTHLLRDEVAAK
jgi:hypothetical protein